MEWACFAFSLCFIQDEAKSLKETKGGKKESSTGTVENKDKKSTKAIKSKMEHTCPKRNKIRKTKKAEKCSMKIKA